MIKLTFNQLLKYNIHIGSSLKNTFLFSSWMLYGKRQNLWIINLYKTFYMFKLAFFILKKIISLNGPIWFINFDKIVQKYIEHLALCCGEFWCGTVWVNGLITNYLNSRLIKSFTIKSKNEVLLTRYTWPRCIFITNSSLSLGVIKECNDAEVACISIVDTNMTRFANINLAIPGNEASIDSVLFYNNIISKKILFEKYFLIINWYENIRKHVRASNFKETLMNLNHFVLNKNLFYLNILKFFFFIWLNKGLSKKFTRLNFFNQDLIKFFLERGYLNYRLNNLHFFYYQIDFVSFFLKRRKMRRKARFLSMESKDLKFNENIDLYLDINNKTQIFKFFLLYMIAACYNYVHPDFYNKESLFFLNNYLKKNNKNLINFYYFDVRKQLVYLTTSNNNIDYINFFFFNKKLVKSFYFYRFFFFFVN